MVRESSAQQQQGRARLDADERRAFAPQDSEHGSPLPDDEVGHFGEQASDPWLLLATLALCAFGLVMVYSASGWSAFANRHSWTYYLDRQAVFLLLGLLLMAFASRLDYRLLRRFSGVGLMLALGALVAVLIVGREVNGAKRWLGIGSLGVQPSELAKLALTIFLATNLARQGERVRSFIRGYLPPMAAMAVTVLLIMAGKDLGNSVLMVAITMAMLFVAGTRASFLLATVLLAAPFLWLRIVGVGYRSERLRQFFTGEDFQVQQGLIAIGSGGKFGLGLGEGRQKLGFLPENHTDFIFAVVGEELGAVGMGLMIALYGLLIWRGIRVVAEAPDRFGAYLATGITAMFGLQAAINFCVVLKVIPAKGITLPLVSAGGSSLMISLLAIGILLSISRRPVPSAWSDLRRPLVVWPTWSKGGSFFASLGQGPNEWGSWFGRAKVRSNGSGKRRSADERAADPRKGAGCGHNGRGDNGRGDNGRRASGRADNVRAENVRGGNRRLAK